MYACKSYPRTVCEVLSFFLLYCTKCVVICVVEYVQHLEKWPKMMPICVHAEGQTLAAVLMLAQLCQRPLHVCHVATKTEVRSLNVFTLCVQCACPFLVGYLSVEHFG